MEQYDLLLQLIGVLDGLRIEYFITGSMASMAYGEPRLTIDIDVVVILPTWQASAMCAAFPPPRYYADDAAAKQAASGGGQFNILDTQSGMKIDVMVASSTAFNESRFARARMLTIGGLPASVASPEDVILMKLVYYKDGGSEKHLRDIASMLKVSGAEVDRAYIDRWAVTLGVAAEWAAMKARVGG